MNNPNRTRRLFGLAALAAAMLAFATVATAQVDANAQAQQTNRNNDQNQNQERHNKDVQYDRKVKPGTMSEGMYRQLERVQNLISEEKYSEAEEQAKKLVDRAGSDYEEAVAAQTLGHIYAAEDNYPQAIVQFKRAVELDALPNPTHYGMIYNIAQLLISTEKYDEGLQWLNRYFNGVPVEAVDLNAYVLAASANAELKNYRTAIDYIKKAISLSKTPKESWYQLLLAMHFELKDYDTAAEVLEKMVKLWPDKKQYWTQLSSVYLELNKDKKALAVLELAHTKGVLNKTSDWKQLAQLYLYLNIPYEGAKVLQEGIDKGIIDADKENLELLGNAWYAAHELDNALEAFKRAGKLSTDGKLDMRRAYLLVDKEEWTEAREALKSALDKGGIKDEGNAYILLGMSHYELGDYDKARDAFHKAMNYDDARKAAGQWLKYVEDAEKEEQANQQAAASGDSESM